MRKIRKGSIIAVKVKTYIDFSGGAWADHFVVKRQLFRVLDMPGNNGSFKAAASDGKVRWFNGAADEIEVMKKRQA